MKFILIRIFIFLCCTTTTALFGWKSLIGIIVGITSIVILEEFEQRARKIK
jgi:hypothetical protein